VKFIVLLIDALNLIRRVDAARRNHAGSPAGSSVDACAQSLTRAVNECAPTHAVCVFEGTGTSFRTELYPGYKAGRSPMPSDLQRDIPAIKQAFLNMGIASVEKDCVEADDVIATLASKIEAARGCAVILSTDKVFLQLLSDSIRVRDHFARHYLDHAYVRDKFQVESAQMADLLALAGDPTNNIPGVPSVGRKTAARLLHDYSSLENVLAHAPQIKGPAGKAIREHGSDALLFLQLTRLKKDIDLGLNLRSFRYRRP